MRDHRGGTDSPTRTSSTAWDRSTAPTSRPPALLASCYERALELADEAGLRSIAFPAMSTGAFGYPMAEAARVALRAIRDKAASLTSVRVIRMVLYSQRDLQVHREALEEIVGP